LISDAAEHLSNLSGVEMAFEYTDDNDEDEDDEEDDEDDERDEDEEDEEGQEGEASTADAPRRPVYITREQIMQLLGHAGLGRIFVSDFTPRGTRRRNVGGLPDDDDDEEESDQDTAYDPAATGRTLRSRRPRGRAAFAKVPCEQGQELMNAGAFGSSPRSENSVKKKKKLAYDIMRRSLGLGSEGRQKNATRLLKQDMIPESVADTIIHYNARCYSGQFSDDGNFFFSCAQDFRVRMYDTSNPYDWKYYKVGSSTAIPMILSLT
jgi:WD repeat-containing protein 23